MRPPPTPTAEPAGDPEALLQEAQQAWLRGQFASAIETSKRVLKIRPGLGRAYQIIAVCSCSLRDADGANKAYVRLDDKIKGMVKTLCRRAASS